MLRRQISLATPAAFARGAKAAAPSATASAVSTSTYYKATEAAAAASATTRLSVEAWQQQQAKLGAFAIPQDTNGLGAANGVETARLSAAKLGGTSPLFAATEKSANEIGWVWVMPIVATIVCWLWTHDFIALYADWLSCEGGLKVYQRRAQLEQAMDKEAEQLKQERPAAY